jgi:hypothetical protein
MFNEGNQIHNSISSSGSDLLTSYRYGSGSASHKVTVPVPQHCLQVLVVVRYLRTTTSTGYVLPIFLVRLFLCALKNQYLAGEVPVCTGKGTVVIGLVYVNDVQTVFYNVPNPNPDPFK